MRNLLPGRVLSELGARAVKGPDLETAAKEMGSGTPAVRGMPDLGTGPAKGMGSHSGTGAVTGIKGGAAVAAAAGDSHVA